MEPQQVRIRLRRLADSFYSLASDMWAMGPPCHGRTIADTDVTLVEALELLVSSAETLAGECVRLRRESVARQIAKLGLGDSPRGLKVQIGAGQYPLDSWINIDTYPAQLAMDVRWGLPFPDGSVRYVFMSHLLEHFYYPAEAEPLIKEIHRVLEPGGTLRLALPDIEKCLRAYVERDREFFAARAATWTWWDAKRPPLQEVLAYAGVAMEPSDLLGNHKFGYDFETLRDLLTRAGFGTVKRSGFLASEIPELRIDDRSEVAGATFRDEHYSLFVEAVS